MFPVFFNVKLYQRRLIGENNSIAYMALFSIDNYEESVGKLLKKVAGGNRHEKNGEH